MGDNEYNVPMQGRREQSSLGRKRVDVYNDGKDVHAMLLATVTKVNYIYNTVDVITTRNNENIGKSRETEGRLSARLPVAFAGSWANGDSFGSMVPITIGDLVLIGFIDGDFNSPIVVNIYKSDVVSRSLANTNKIYGNPESQEDYKTAMAIKTVTPAMTMDAVWGDGTILKTYAGNAFLATSTETEAQATLDDTYMELADLYQLYSPNGNLIEPRNQAISKLLYQHGTKGITGNKTTFFIDEYGTVRLSKVLLDINKRSYFEMDNKGDIGFRHRPNSAEPYREPMDDEVPEKDEDTYIGIRNGVPTVSKGDKSVEVRDDNMYINGESLDDILKKYTAELEGILIILEAKVKEITDIVDQIDLEMLKSIQQAINALIIEFKQLREEVIIQGNDILDLDDKLNTFITVTYKTFTEATTRRLVALEDGINKLSNEVSDARGTYDSLQLRLETMTNANTALQARVDELEALSSGLKQLVTRKTITTGTQSVVYTLPTAQLVEPYITISTKEGTVVTWDYTRGASNQYTGIIFRTASTVASDVNINIVVYVQ